MIARRIRWIGSILIAGSVCALVGCLSLRTPEPGAFYRTPATVPGDPGVLLRQEPFAHKIPPGSRAWKILYTTTRGDGSPAIASAIVMVPLHPHHGPRELIAWLHGTTGVVPGCAPPLLRQPFFDIPPLDQAIEKGWVIVATDYVGLGTEGPHPFLLGEGEARSSLDSIRAVRQMRELSLTAQTVVWGASQGGHAALWTGIVAPAYASDLNVAGVAAIAPASDLPTLVKASQNTLSGRVISALILQAYIEAYPDVRLEDYVSPGFQPRAREWGSRCLALPQAIPSAVESWVMRKSLFNADPAAGALGRRLAENSPRRKIAAPLFIAQGSADDLVLPAIQRRYVEAQCDAGQSLEYRVYAKRNHTSILMKDSPYNADLMRWTEERFGGKPVPTGCQLPEDLASVAVAAGEP